MPERADVVVVGSGPGGAAAAITLARRGASVAVVDRSARHPTLGEGLPPGAMPVLQRLDLWKRFLADDHQRVYGNRSVWSGPAVVDRDFIRSPYGAGWRLDMPRFEAMLADALADAGVAVHAGTRLRTCRREHDGGWTLTFQTGNMAWELECEVIVDATGRARRVARELGAPRWSYDRLVGIVAVLSPCTAGADHDSLTYVEAVRDGWWYATLLHDGRLAVGFMTDADIAAASGARIATGWEMLLAHTEQIRARVQRHGYRLQEGLRLVAADSSCLRSVGGDGWFAVGDAAGAHDPLSSQGITSALLSGIRAGEAAAEDSAVGLAWYEQQTRDAYARYLANWLGYYDLERRWPDATFWQRRRRMLEQVLAS